MTNVLQFRQETLTLTNADEEYSWLAPANTGYFTIQPRTNVDVRYSPTSGKVAGSVEPYGVLKSGQVWNSPERVILPHSTTFYFASSAAGTVIVIDYFTQLA